MIKFPSKYDVIRTAFRSVSLSREAHNPAAVRHVRRDKSSAEGRHVRVKRQTHPAAVHGSYWQSGDQWSRRRRDRAERWKRIEPPPAANWTTFKNSPLVTHRRNATRQCRRERRRILLIDDYEAAFARLECIKKGSRAMYAIHATTRLDADSRLTWRVKYKRDAARARACPTTRDRTRGASLFHVGIRSLRDNLTATFSRLAITMSLKFAEVRRLPAEMFPVQRHRDASLTLLL